MDWESLFPLLDKKNRIIKKMQIEDQTVKSENFLAFYFLFLLWFSRDKHHLLQGILYILPNIILNTQK